MSKKLYVGQKARVKYVRHAVSPWWRAGVVVAVSACVQNSPGGAPADYEVTVSNGSHAWPTADQLEPYIPDGGPSELSYTELMDRLKAGEVECV